MSVNLIMDGTTYEGATKITVGGKSIDIAEVGGGGSSMELVGTVELSSGAVSGSANFWNPTTYGGSLPDLFKPMHENGIKILDFAGTNKGSASANGIQKAVYVYGDSKTMVLQTGYRGGNSRQSSSSEVSPFATHVAEVYSGNTYTTAIPTTCTGINVYEVEIPAEIASAILAVIS